LQYADARLVWVLAAPGSSWMARSSSGTAAAASPDASSAPPRLACPAATSGASATARRKLATASAKRAARSCAVPRFERRSAALGSSAPERRERLIGLAEVEQRDAVRRLRLGVVRRQLHRLGQRRARFFHAAEDQQ